GDERRAAPHRPPGGGAGPPRGGVSGGSEPRRALAGGAERDRRVRPVKPELLVRPRAKAELGEAFRWYEERREGLGREFLRAALEALSAIEESPERYPRVRGEVRLLTSCR